MESLVHHIKLKHISLTGAMNHIYDLRQNARMSKSEQIHEQSPEVKVAQFDDQSIGEQRAGVEALQKFKFVWETIACEIEAKGKSSIANDNLYQKLKHVFATQKYEPKLCRKDYDYALAYYLMHVSS